MPINPNIAMGVNPIRFKQRDPYEEFSKQSQLQALMTSQADDELTRTAMRESGGDTESALKRLISGGGSLKAITGLQGMADARAKAKSEAAYREAQTGKLLSETEAAGIAKHRDMLSLVKDPQTAAQWIQMGYSDPVIGKRFQSLVPMEQAIQSIPQDPAEFQSWVQKQGLGATKFIELNKPVLYNRNLGNVDELTSTPGLGGAPTVLSSREIKESEAQRLAREQKADEAAKGRSNQWSIAKMADDRARARMDFDQGNATADAGGPSQVAFVKKFGKAEPGYRWKADGTVEPIPGGSKDAKVGAAAEKDAARAQGAINTANNVISTIDEALAKTGLLTAGFGGLTSVIPATPARDLKGSLETVKANIGFDRLQAMREASPTGGALGQVAVQELNALQASIASLDQLQSPDKLRANLEKVTKHYNNWKDVVKKANAGVVDVAKPPGASFDDAEKERRYQEWKAKQK